MSCFYKRNMLAIILLFTFFTLILSSCDMRQGNTTTSDKEAKDKKTVKTILPPISPQDGEFVQVYGWINKNIICYSAKTDTDYTVYTYNLHTGKHTSIYKSEYTLANVSINDHYLLIYNLLSDTEGEIHIIDSKGNKLFSKAITSYETSFAWNPYNENEVLITTFSKEWESKVYKLDINKSTIDEFSKSTPFPKWIATKEVMYLDWDQANPSLYAPLKIYNVESKLEREVQLNSVYFVDQSKDQLFTISSESEYANEAIYRFYDTNLEEKISVSLPRLSKFSNWTVPNYTFYDNQLITFVPKTAGDAETYQDGYDLISINMLDGERKELIADIEDQPLQISSDGNYCLYGYYLENLINLNTGEISYLFPSN
ncbi:hypothetical protein [Bacillus sp. B1-b2]|uniref:YqgU-like beta propeller domain-containing protein n=1 Tax=Bacillus sp. B1-b2 TaxID=2653201 RepID=UPI001262108F|nr:hypothetical protein [Bacillus sp. B1-b2]KAB7670026.1 hypothetical protein F9279_09835 [Bacillus sp. B1-b2]